MESTTRNHCKLIARSGSFSSRHLSNYLVWKSTVSCIKCCNVDKSYELFTSYSLKYRVSSTINDRGDNYWDFSFHVKLNCAIVQLAALDLYYLQQRPIVSCQLSPCQSNIGKAWWKLLLINLVKLKSVLNYFIDSISVRILLTYADICTCSYPLKLCQCCWQLLSYGSVMISLTSSSDSPLTAGKSLKSLVSIGQMAQVTNCLTLCTGVLGEDWWTGCAFANC